MNILVGKTFGIGNAICAIPMIKAIKSLGHKVDLLIGSFPDDFGAREILKNQGENLYFHSVPDRTYDLAIMAMPFDGRWKNGIHYRANQVWDERPRPDPSTMGFSSWQKHEIEYQMDWARQLGFAGETPNCSFTTDDELLGDFPPALVWKEKCIYVGVGYKKDAAGFWKQKHFGNEKFAKLIKLLLDSDPQVLVRSTGDVTDMQLSMFPISKMVNNGNYITQVTNLEKSFLVMASCGSYVGNDTGMAHVAASLGKKVAVYFNMDNAWTKSRPWCAENRVVNGVGRDVSPEEMFATIQELRNG